MTRPISVVVCDDVPELRRLAPFLERLRGAGLSFRTEVVSGPGGRQILLADPAGGAQSMTGRLRRVLVRAPLKSLEQTVDYPLPRFAKALRRKAQLLNRRPDLRVVDLRGNNGGSGANVQRVAGMLLGERAMDRVRDPKPHPPPPETEGWLEELRRVDRLPPDELPFG